MLAILALLTFAQVSSPIGEGVCFTMTATIDPRSQVGQSIEGIGAYCSLSGCQMTGSLTMLGPTGKNAVSWANTTPCGTNGSVCWYYQAPFLKAFYASADRLLLSNSNGSATFVGNVSMSGQLDVTLAIVSSRAASVALQMSGTGWLESGGDTSANIETRVPTAGNGGLIYDDTNTRWRAYEGTDWNRLHHFNGDGGAPWGPLNVWDAYNPLTDDDTNVLSIMRFYPRQRVLRQGFTVVVPGAGAGDVQLQVFDLTGSTALCTTTSVSCSALIGASNTDDCSPYTAAANAGSDYRLVIDCSACDPGGCPLGNVTAVLQSID